MEFLFVLIFYLVGGMIFGCAARAIANSKGYDGGFAWGFWLWIIGLLVVGFRPDQSTASPPVPAAAGLKNTVYPPKSGYAPNPVKRGWTCLCGAQNPSSIDVCLSCRRTREEATEERVHCPHCGAGNKKANEQCFACGKPMNGEVPHEAPAAVDTTAEIPASTPDFSDTLRKLAALHEQGILTDDEFQQKKAEILARI